MSSKKILFLKIGNTNFSYSYLDQKHLIKPINQKSIDELNKLLLITSAIICSTNSKILSKLKITKNHIVNPFLKNNRIDYSNISYKELGHDLYYAIEFLAKNESTFNYFSLGTFWALIQINNNIIERIEIFLGNQLTKMVFTEYSDIKFKNSTKPINNYSIFENSIVERKNKMLLEFNKNKTFWSGYDNLIPNLNFHKISNIELRAMYFFYKNDLFKK